MGNRADAASLTAIDYYSRCLLARHLTRSYSAIEVSHVLKEPRQGAERLHGPLSKPPLLMTDNDPSFWRRFGDLIAGLGAEINELKAEALSSKKKASVRRGRANSHRIRT